MNAVNENNNDKEPEVKKPKFWGTLFIISGIGGLTYATYLLINCSNMVPMIGVIISGVLIGALSIFMIVLGYRVIKHDY